MWRGTETGPAISSDCLNAGSQLDQCLILVLIFGYGFSLVLIGYFCEKMWHLQMHILILFNIYVIKLDNVTY